jgi:FixJ family two-component response regulator
VVIRVKKRQIFVVEDDEAVRASTRALLEAQGFLVRDFVDAMAIALCSITIFWACPDWI